MRARFGAGSKHDGNPGPGPLPAASRPASLGPPGPRGGLTTARGAALYIGALLGPGLLLLPGLAAAEAGPASVLAWAGLLVLSGLFAVVFAALGRGFPSAGGVIGYVRAGLGARASDGRRLVLPGRGGGGRAGGLPDRRRLRHRAHRRRPARPGR